MIVLLLLMAWSIATVCCFLYNRQLNIILDQSESSMQMSGVLKLSEPSTDVKRSLKRSAKYKKIMD